MKELFVMMKSRISLLVTLFLLSSIVAQTSVAQTTDYSMKEQWETHHAVGKYLNSKPPKPDQVFNIQYRVTNGIIEKFEQPEQLFFKVELGSKNGGLFEIKIPQNYPFTNEMGEGRENSFIILLDGKEIDPKNKLKKTDCFFVYSIPFSGNQTLELGYTSLPVEMPFYGDEVPQYCIKETITQTLETDNKYLSPIQQLKAGIKATDVQCKSIQKLVIKTSNDMPACVKDASVSKLIERGWAKPV
ncbi:MAG: hypothetical protein WAO91_05240 [Candidatus Nitrosotenuis sp.]